MADCTCTTYGRCVVCQPQREAEIERVFKDAIEGSPVKAGGTGSRDRAPVDLARRAQPEGSPPVSGPSTEYGGRPSHELVSARRSGQPNVGPDAGGPVRPTPTTLVDRSSNPGRGGATPFHAAPHPQAGKAVLVDLDGGDLVTFYVEDWWDRVAGGSWRTAQGYPAAIKYALRIGRRVHLPFDDEVVYGKINGFGVLVHDSEIRAVAHA